MKKKKWIIGLALLLTVLIVTGGTMAWFTTTTDPIDNKFKAGTLKIQLVDVFDEGAAQNVNPGDCFSKDVYVKNIGSKRAMVRIKAEMVFEGGLDLDPVKYELNDSWELKNGYYYYKNVVNPEGRSQSLFKDNKVCFDGAGMDNQYQGKKFTITVKADAIQATNGAPTAEGWLFDPLAPPTP